MEIIFDKFAIAGVDDAEGSGPSSPIEMSYDGARVVQVDEFIQGEHPDFTDRDNKTTTVIFTTVRQHESFGEAQMFCLTHGEELPTTGELIFRGVGSGGGAHQRIVKKAALLNVKSATRGVQSTHSYQFMMGKIEKAKVTR